MDDFPDIITIRDKYGPAMEINDQAAADVYFEKCVRHSTAFLAVGRPEAEQIERANLGYFAGYYDDATRDRVERLFRCAHPIFGTIANHGVPTTREALKAGLMRPFRDLLRKAEPGPTGTGLTAGSQ